MKSTRKLTSPGWSYTHRGYALLHSFRQLSRSTLATGLTLAVLGITMTLPSVFFLLSDDVSRLPIGTGKGQSLTAYLDPAISDLEGAEIARSIEKQATVNSVDYISREEALATFQQQTEFDDVLDLLNENPLPGAVVVYPANTNSGPDSATGKPVNGMIELLATRLEAMPAVERVQFDLQWVARLEAVIALAKLAIMVLGVLLILTALMVIGNTIRLEMLRRKREMDVTRLLGAPAGFVRRPFVYLGALYGFLGSVVAVLGAIGIQYLINPPIRQLALTYGTQFSLSSPPLEQISAIVGIATLLGIIGAIMALYWQRSHPNSV